MDYEFLESLGCEESVRGGLKKTIYVIPAWAVISTPAYNSTPSSDPIRLKAGSSATGYTFPEDVLQIKETDKKGPNGPYSEITLTGYRNQLNPEHMDEIRKLQPGHYVLIYIDVHLNQRILGTKDKPFEFSYNAESGTGKGDIAKIDWQFRGISEGPPVYQNPAIIPPNAATDPTAILNSVFDTGSECSYNLTSFTSRQIAGDLITASTPDSAVDLIFEFRNGGTLLYTGIIDPGDDPTNLANWGITPGSRTAPNFQTEIVDQITGASSVDFLLDLTAISDVLPTPGELDISLIIDEGGQTSPASTKTLTLCYEAPEILSIVSVTPADNSTEVSISLPEVVVQFSKNIVDLGGSITLRDKSDNSQVYTELLSNTSIVTDSVTWTLPGGLDINKEYYVEILAGALEGSGGESWAGTTTETFNFSTISNAPPEAQNLQINALGAGYETGEDVQIASTYFDNEGDVQDVGSTVVELYRFDNLTDANNKTNGTVIHTGKTVYTLTANEGDKYIAAREVPFAQTGTLQGLEYWSTVQLVTIPKIEAFSYTHTEESHELQVAFASGAEYVVEWGDATSETFTGVFIKSAHTHNYAGPGTYTVTVKTVDPANCTNVDLENRNITSIDVTPLVNLSGLEVHNNPSLTAVTMPNPHTGSCTNVNTFNTGISSIDLSGMIFSNAALNLNGSANLQTVTLTGASGTLFQFRADYCDLTGALNFPAGLNMHSTGTVTRWILLNNNPNLTSIDVSNMSGNLTDLVFRDCGILGDVNLGSFNCINCNFDMHGNPGMNGFDMSNCTGTLKTVNMQYCAASGTQTITLPFSANAGNTIYYQGNTAFAYDIDLSGSGGALSNYRVDNSNYTGAFEAKVFNFINANITGITCTGITSVDLTGSTGSLYFFYFYNSTNLTGNIDLSAFDWAPVVYLRIDNTDVTGLSLKLTDTTNIGTFTAQNANLTGTFVFPAWNPNSLALNVRSNPNLTSVDFSNLTGTIGELFFDNCNITGLVDMSGMAANFKSTDAAIYAMNNPLMTGIIHSATLTGNFHAYQIYSCACSLQANGLGNATFTADINFQVQDNGLSSAEVDAWVEEAHRITPLSGGSGYLHFGGSNAANTVASDPEVTDLVNAGHTVFVN